MHDRLDLPNTADIELEIFELNVDETAKRIERAIIVMDKNKAAGGDQIHVEMLKTNAPKVTRTLRKCWKAKGRSRKTPEKWLEGFMVPVFKAKGEMN